MDDMEKMEICECGTITYMLKEHFAEEGERLHLILEKIITKQAMKDMLK